MFVSLFLALNIMFSWAQDQEAINRDIKNIDRQITQAQRKAHKTCKTKLKFSIDHSAYDSLDTAKKVVMYERLKSKLSETLETFFAKCKSSDFSGKLKKYKSVDFEASTASPWKVKARSAKIKVIMGNSPGSGIGSKFDKKIR